MPVTVRKCEVCGQPYEAQRSTRKYCSTRCRTRATRSGKASARVVPIRPGAAGEVPAEEPAADTPTVAATRRELEALDQADSALGAAALALAFRVDHHDRDTGSALAALSRELRTVMDAARASGKPAGEVETWQSRRLALLGQMVASDAG